MDLIIIFLTMVLIAAICQTVGEHYANKMYDRIKNHIDSKNRNNS